MNLSVDHVRHMVSQHELPVDEFADKAGVSRHSLYEFLRKRANPRAAMFLQICRFLGFELRPISSVKETE